MRRTFLAFSILAITAAPALAAPVSVATPVAPWEASTEGGVCRMQRSFEADGQPHLLILEQNSPGRAVGIAMAGPSLAALSPETPLRVSFAADHAGFEKKARIEPNRQFGHLAVLQGVWLETGKPDDVADRSRIDLGAAQDVEQIAVSQDNGGLTFATGSLADAALVLNECTAQILRGWGLDPASQYSLQRSAFPAEPSKLAKEMRKSYPTGAARGLRSGPLEVAALIDANGAATGCRIIVASPWTDIDEATCKAMLKARYTPALNASGNAVASYWKTRVTFFANEFEAQQQRP